MILVSLGSNLSGKWGSPAETLERAITELPKWGLNVMRRTPVISTKPIAGSSGPKYTNALAEIGGFVPPHALLWRLKQIEHAAGRGEARFAGTLGRLPRWRPRVLDLDLIDWHGVEMGPQDSIARTGYVPLSLPHRALYTREYMTDLLKLLHEAPRI